MTNASLQVTETAYVTAHARDVEHRRPDAIIQDPIAACFLTPDRSQAAARLLGDGGDVIVVRTKLIDDLVISLATKSAHPPLVLNLGAGFDTRPYRLVDHLPAGSTFIEVDRGDSIQAKQEALAPVEQDHLPVRRYGHDLANPGWLDDLIGAEPDIREAIVIVEGVFTYLDPADLAAMVQMLGASGRFRWMIGDLVSPQTARRLRQATLSQSDAGLNFHVLESLDPFDQAGWRCQQYISTFAALRKLRPTSPTAYAPTEGGTGSLIDGIALFELCG